MSRFFNHVNSRIQSISGFQRRKGTEASTAAKNSASSGGICTFSADVIAKIDFASPGAQNGPGVHTVGIFCVPRALSAEQYTQCSTSSLPCLQRRRLTRNMTW
jgi:hypothetical protein